MLGQTQIGPFTLAGTHTNAYIKKTLCSLYRQCSDKCFVTYAINTQLNRPSNKRKDQLDTEKGHTTLKHFSAYTLWRVSRLNLVARVYKALSTISTVITVAGRSERRLQQQSQALHTQTHNTFCLSMRDLCYLFDTCTHACPSYHGSVEPI